MPAGVVTVTFTVPLPAGAIATISIAEMTVKPVAARPPNATALASARALPRIGTLVPA